MARQVVPTTADPYHLTAEGIKEPPEGWRASIRYFGPGLLLSASIVGSGELIATTTLGAVAGFAILWLVLISTTVKVAVQIELARWTISTGKPCYTGLNQVPPKLGRISAINILAVLLYISKIVQSGGIVGGVVFACSLLFPIGGPPLGFTSIAIWTAIIVVAIVTTLYSNRYGLLERVAGFLVAIFALLTIAVAFGLPFTPFAYGTDDVLSGLTFSIPAGALGAAIAMFGITGVGADEITYYTYWCVEKGYARWAGPPDGSEEWVRRAKGWIGVMYKDAWLSWVIYTLGTIAFFFMGAAVLHPQGLVPQGNEMITTLSRMYTDVLGRWVGVLFLLAAIAVLASTLWGSTPAKARICTNLLAVVGALDWQNPKSRLRWIRFFTVLMPTASGVLFLVFASPVLMVQIGGIMTGVFLLALVLAVWYLRHTETDPRLHGGGAFNILLMISSIAIILVAVYSVVEVFGIASV